MKMLNRNGTRLFSPLKIIVAGVLLLLGLTASAVLIFLAAMSVSQTVSRAEAPAPLAYDQLYYRPVFRDICPGINPSTGVANTLSFTVTQTVREAGRLDVLRTYWDRKLNRAAHLSDNSTPAIHDQLTIPFEIAGESRVIPLHVTIPDLPAGSYWMVTSVMGVNTNQVQYEVPFVIPEGCPVYHVPNRPFDDGDLSYWIGPIAKAPTLCREDAEGRPSCSYS